MCKLSCPAFRGGGPDHPDVGTAWSKRTGRQHRFEQIPVSGTGDRGFKSHPPH
jgi:hypothetical protein